MINRIIFWGLCIVLLFVPLPIGSVEEWAVFVFEAATLGLFLLFLGGQILPRRGRRAAGLSSGPHEGLSADENRYFADNGNVRYFRTARLPGFFKAALGVFVAL